MCFVTPDINGYLSYQINSRKKNNPKFQLYVLPDYQRLLRGYPLSEEESLQHMMKYGAGVGMDGPHDVGADSNSKSDFEFQVFLSSLFHF